MTHALKDPGSRSNAMHINEIVLDAITVPGVNESISKMLETYMGMVFQTCDYASISGFFTSIFIIPFELAIFFFTNFK